MSEFKLTSEQEAVIHHPLGRHARVLAVAGSGKTTTMAHRIKHLVTEPNVTRSTIRVLMFNRMARVQFQQRLADIGVPRYQQPPVDTFHSFSFGLIQEMMHSGLLPTSTDLWLDGREEQIWLNVNIAITNLERKKTIPPNKIDPEEAIQAVSLWKGSLIPPERAGYRGNPYLPEVYAEFERLRQRRNALTFDDFVPMAVGILEHERSVRAEWCNREATIIVDEYQDINFGQQRLVELLAGERADVMVVGDDDQTICEWRGARPNYIIREYRSVFANKPHMDYTLSRSFRFGPVIAQAAFNTITFNTTRVDKPLIAHFIDKSAEINVIETSRDNDANKELAERIIALVKNESVPPSQIRVLVRTFAQLSALEAQFLDRRIPYCVKGRAPFFERRENRVLLDYLRFALALDDPVTKEMEYRLLSVANTPSRKLARKELSRVMRSARFHGASSRQALGELVDNPNSPLSSFQQETVIAFVELLEKTRQRIKNESGLQAGALLLWLIDELDYLDHFSEYYGDGWESFDRKRAVNNFVYFAAGTGLGTVDFIRHVDKLDTTQGAPEDQQIVMTTVFREKGCEYDYVIIPNCLEGYMPCLREAGNLVFDKVGKVEEPEPSEAIENERRLFYVALTRARKAILIGTSTVLANDKDSSQLPSRFLDEMQLRPTESMMEPLQRFASGNDRARDDLLIAVRQFGGIRKIARNLTAEYLKDIGDKALTLSVSRLIAASKEMPFSYRYALKPPIIPSEKIQPKAPPLHSAWDAVQF